MNGMRCMLAAADIDWGLVGSTVITGIVVVFLILAILVLFLWLFGKVFAAINAREKKPKANKNAQPVKQSRSPAPAQRTAAPAAAITAEPVAEEEYEEEDDDEIIAVIAAAIAAYGEAEGKQYRIAGIKRPKQARSGWSAAGLADNMRGFQN